jgi:hypothetical protein
MQNEQAVVMYRKRAQNVKRCEFRKFKEWARDYMFEHDYVQMEMIHKQLVKARQEDRKAHAFAKTGDKHSKPQKKAPNLYPAVHLDTVTHPGHVAALASTAPAGGQPQNQQQKSTNPK